MTLTEERIRSIKEQAEALLRKNGYDNSLPVPTEDIAASLDYNITGFFPDAALEGVSGIVDHEHKVISLNRSESARRQRFTLAHEIGHVILHKGESFVDFRKTIMDPTDEREREANRFASELLMPAEPFLQYWIKFNGDISRMAVKFAVSQDAILHRSNELKIS
jgi:Zn-dependent peptidase ImmA (M78 family)